MADALENHQVWWSGESWSCTCETLYLRTDIEAERHYLITHNMPTGALDARPPVMIERSR
jgi:hypothetical protein